MWNAESSSTHTSAKKKKGLVDQARRDKSAKRSYTRTSLYFIICFFQPAFKDGARNVRCHVSDKRLQKSALKIAFPLELHLFFF